MAVASEQWVMVGVISTRTRVKVFVFGKHGEGVIWMSGRLTTASEPRESGCSGSEIVEIRSISSVRFGPERKSQKEHAIYLLLVDGLDCDILVAFKLRLWVREVRILNDIPRLHLQ
jgi:hypothetical protein